MPHARHARVILIVLDSVGVGELPDAAVYGDEGSDTLGNIRRRPTARCRRCRSLGLGRVVDLGGTRPDARRRRAAPSAGWPEASPGQGLGHRPLGADGLVLERPFPVFPARLSRRT